MQSRTRDTDIENKYMDTKRGKEEWGELGNWDRSEERRVGKEC